MTLRDAAWILGSYLLGSISFAYIVGRLMKGLDLRTIGSGNLGATNVGRALGRKWGFLVYGLDLLKGIGPVLIATQLLDDRHLFDGWVPLSLLMGSASVLGHCFPAHLGFRGGKGVATASGVVLALTPLAFLIGVACFVIATLTSRMIAVGSCVAALAIPCSLVLLTGGRTFSDQSQCAVFLFYALLATLVLVRHHTNIVRIFHGTESKLGDKIE